MAASKEIQEPGQSAKAFHAWLHADDASQIAAVYPTVDPGNQITLDSLEPGPFCENIVWDAIIGQMRQQIENGPDWVWSFNWCLRYTTSANGLFVTGPQPLLLEGPAPNVDEAMTHPETLIWFPLCRQACRVGSLCRFDQGTDEASPWVLSHVHEPFARHETGYVISSSRIEGL